MKENPRQGFRWAPHTGGVSSVKPRDYEPGEEIAADSAYALWASLRGTPEALDVGDVLESDTGALSIFKYVGFEEARWVLPEVKTGLEGVSPLAGPAEPIRTDSSGS